MNLTRIDELFPKPIKIRDPKFSFSTKFVLGLFSVNCVLHSTESEPLFVADRLQANLLTIPPNPNNIDTTINNIDTTINKHLQGLKFNYLKAKYGKFIPSN